MSAGFAPPPGAPAIKTSVLIAAPIAEVWSILTAFEAYGAWNACIPHIEGVAEEGASIVLQPFGEAEKTVRIDALEPYRMHWVGGAEDMRDLRGDHFFELEPVGAGETLCLHREFFTGRLAAAIVGAYGEAIRGNFETFNSCLKAAAENPQNSRAAVLQQGKKN